MKSQVMVLSITICMAFGATAQTGGPGSPNKGPQPQGGMPPQPGQPNQPGQPPQPGQPNNPASGPTWPAAKCEKEMPKLKKAAENCVNIKKEDQRKECFAKLETKFPREFWDSCKAMTEPLRNEMEAKAKQKYPDQTAGMPGQDKGPHGGMPNQPGMPGQPGHSDQPGMPGSPGDHAKGPAKKMDCGPLLKKVKTEGGKCLKIKEQAQRKICFDKIGQEIEKKNAGDACGEALNPLKAEFQSQEAQKYPGEAPSIQ